MKRIIAVAVGVVALLAFFVFTTQFQDGDTASGRSSIEAASLGPVGEPAELPTPKFTRTMYAAADLAESDPVLDICRGPVAIDVGDNRPVLVAEHDYCGGSAWMPKLRMSDTVELKGDGVEPGIYQVSVIGYQLRHKAKVSDLPAADVVLQTCVSKEKMVLVGLRHLDPAASA